ncbi:MAG TPA: hypothetical protein VJB89_00315 [Candidatus Nanoarchaeia archaeon]|nr:hypothetical protein [Candidatus Nanoarchaeia archaeon]
MKKKVVGGLIIGFSILLLLVILSFFIDFKAFSQVIYIIFLIDFLILLLVFIRKAIKRKKGIEVNETVFEKKVKWIVYLIPIIIFGYILWINFNPFTEIIVYDIGSSGDRGILTPDRVSNPMMTDNHKISYREVKNPLVYFDVPIPIGTKSITIQIKFKDIIAPDSLIKIGGRDKEKWNYLYKTVYDKRLQNKTVYFLDNIPVVFPKESIIYIDPLLNITFENENKLKDDYSSELIINNSLRGNHTIFLYVKGNLEFEIWKKDLNLRSNDLDELEVSFYKKDKLIKTVTLPDDGNDYSSGNITIQKGRLEAKNLKEGVYRINLISNEDVIINKIMCNCGKMVFENKISIYEPTQVYTESPTEVELKFKTYHNTSLQTITINKEEKLKVDKSNTFFSYKINKGEHLIEIPKGDTLIVSPYYFSFSKDSYFTPFDPVVVEDPSIADFILLERGENKIINEKNGWIIGEVEFDIKDLYLSEGNKQNFILNFPINNNTFVPVDWIKISIKK